MIIISRVMIYSGVPLSDHAETAYLNTCAKSNSIFWNDPVLQFFQTGYQTEVMSLKMYSEFVLTPKTLPCGAGLALRKRKSARNARKFVFIPDKNCQ